ncbi:MAG: VTT domain-containing protein [Rhodobacteraceae bacterium]|nr:VTT domain-containing protein [Paracoccaceae bacterium]
MIELNTIVDLVQSHGLYLLAPLAVLEGPIVSVLAGWMVQLGLLHFSAVFALVVLADLFGDALLYLLGRRGLTSMSLRWRARLGLRRARLNELSAHFNAKGGRTLVVAKLTHSLGFAALVAAGAARMPFVPFVWYNLLATVPKSLAFLLLGYSLGHAYTRIDSYIFWVSLGMLGGMLALAAVWYLRKRSKP